MEFSAIAPLWGTEVSAQSIKIEKTEEAPAGASFADIFISAVENVKTTDVEKNELEYLLSVGQLDNPAELTIAATKAQTSVELLVQLRSRTLEAYNDIIKLSI